MRRTSKGRRQGGGGRGEDDRQGGVRNRENEDRLARAGAGVPLGCRDSFTHFFTITTEAGKGEKEEQEQYYKDQDMNEEDNREGEGKEREGGRERESGILQRMKISPKQFNNIN